MRRHAARLLLALVLGTIPMAIGVVVALTTTGAGQELLARDLSVRLSRILRGRFEIGAISGSYLSDLAIDSLVVRDTAGVLLARIPHVAVTYLLPNLLAGRIVFNTVRVDHPEIRIIKHANRRMNYEEILKLGEGPPGGKVGRLVEFREFHVVNGSLRVEIPWSPPDTVSTEAGRAKALAADRARPGRLIEESPEGLRKILVFHPLTVGFRVVRVSTPDHLPLTFDIDTLATKLNDPGITVIDAVAHGWTAGDSLAFTFSRGALPHSEFSGGGVVTWPHGPPLFDFALDSRRLDLVDLRWISPDFPAMSGRSQVAARSASETRTAYVLRDLHLQGLTGRIDGQVTVLTDQRRGLGVEDMNLTTANLDLDVVRPYIPTLPFFGTLSGKTAGRGFFDGMDLTLNWDFADSRVPEHPVTHLTGGGHVILGGVEGLVFDSLAIAESSVDLRTVRLLAPAVALDGRLEASGSLRGPLRNVTFQGTAAQHDGDRPVSRLVGTVRLDTRRDTLGLATDVELAPLSMEGIRRSFPALRTQGELRGHLKMSGTLDHLTLDADLRGQIGTVHAVGGATILPPKWGADSLTLVFEGLDLQALRGVGPPTSLTGTLFADGVADTVAAPHGRLDLELTHGWVREFTLDSVAAHVAVQDSVIRLDNLLLTWQGGRVAGAGTLGWVQPHEGNMQIEVDADDLTPLDSLVTVLSGLGPDTAKIARRLSGVERTQIVLAGSLDSLRASLETTVRSLQWRGLRASHATITFGWTGGQHPLASASLVSDSITYGKWLFRDVATTASGTRDSLGWAGGLRVGEASRFHGGGGWRRGAGASVLSVDSMTAELPAHSWRLSQPVSVALGDSSLTFALLALEAVDGSGSIRLEGRLPRAGPGAMTIQVLGLDLRDLYGLMQWDTAGVKGNVGLDLTIGGTGALPTIRGIGSLNDASFGEFGAPFVQAVIDYADKKLETNLVIWKTGQRVLRIEAHLPLDLALHSVPRRQLDGPISVRAIADSTDLVVIEAFTPSVRQVEGKLNADAEITGTWNNPRLAGFMTVVGGAVGLPGLGVRFTSINGGARLTGDSVSLDTLHLDSGEGKLVVTGGLRLENLSNPILALRLQPTDFRFIDVRGQLRLDATGDVTLDGPIFQPRLSGSLTANEGILYFADLVTKRIVDLENPGDTGLIDLSLVRAQKLGAAFSNRFIDSLRVDNLQVAMGESVWLRSSEANIQLDGTVTVNKIRRDVRFDGILNAVRGNYTLKVGFVSRDFVVERGTVRYFGTPDLNADLDIQAQHVVHTVQGNEDIPVIAKITGTMLAPKLSLESTQRPPLSETELVSYLMFGKPTFSLNTGTTTQGGNDQLASVQTVVSFLSSALSSELQRTLISDLGMPIDYIEIRPGGSSTPGDPITGAGGATQLAELAAGWQIGRKTFLTLNADLCTNQAPRLYPTLEFRWTAELKLKASVEPTYPCTVIRPADSFSTFAKYQVGFDVIWSRDQ